MTRPNSTQSEAEAEAEKIRIHWKEEGFSARQSEVDHYPKRVEQHFDSVRALQSKNESAGYYTLHDAAIRLAKSHGKTAEWWRSRMCADWLQGRLKMRDGSAWMTIDPPARPADPKKLREWEAAARFGASGMHKMLDPHHYPHLDSLDVVSATDLDEWLKPTGYTFSVPIAEPAPRASATEVAAAEVETEVAAGTLVPVLEQFAESELPVKKAAMIARHKGKWPTIEGDMKDANRNGLKDARTGHRGWLEKKALEWAHNRNKLPGTEKAVDELARTVNSMVDLQGQKHTMKR